MLHSSRLPWKLAEKIQQGTPLTWRLDHAEALLDYRRPRARSLWYLAWAFTPRALVGAKQDGVNADNPSVIYEVACVESHAVTAIYANASTSRGVNSQAAVGTEAHGGVWSPTEESRISKLQVALSVTRAIYYAAIELDAGLTLTQIQRRWLTPKMIKAANEMYATFIHALMLRDRLSEGFIRKTVVFERDLHLKQVQRILARKLSIAVLSTGISILERGQCVWFGPPSEAIAAFECFDS